MSTERGFDWDLEAADLLTVLRDGVIVADAAQNLIVGWNPAAEQIFGYSADEAIGMAVSCLMPEHMRDRHEAGLARYAATGQGHFVDNHDPLELPGLTKAGDEIAVEFQLTPLRQSRDDRLYAIAIVRDVTERNREIEDRRKLEEAAAASQRLEAVGQLATGVAHDFNNLLTVILGQIYFVKDSPQLEDRQRESLQAVEAAAERGASLSRQLLAFSRKSVVSRSAVSLNEALTNAANFLGRTLGADIDLRLELAPTLPRTMMDAGQVDQVLTNLALNARDAMPDGGVLTICTCLRSISEEDAASRIPPGLYVSLTVSDTGVGMTEDVLNRVFEPFFTTKPRERGTGMGLAMVYGVVTQAGGLVRCESAMGEGTTFEILLPVAAIVPESVDVDEPAKPVQVIGGAEVLLVDDDPGILAAVVRILERAGHSVTAMADSMAALELADGEKVFDLLISDVVMPGVNGLVLARELIAANRVRATLLISGYPEGAGSPDDLHAEGISFLAKPFTPDALLQHVGEILSKTDRGGL